MSLTINESFSSIREPAFKDTLEGFDDAKVSDRRDI